MRPPRMTIDRLMVFTAVFAITMTAWVLYDRWVAVSVARRFQEFRQRAGVPPDQEPGDYIIPVARDLAFWTDLDHFFHRFWFMVVVFAALLSFAMAAIFPRGRATTDAAVPPARTR